MVKIIKKNKIFQVTDFAFVNKHKYECFTRNIQDTAYAAYLQKTLTSSFNEYLSKFPYIYSLELEDLHLLKYNKGNYYQAHADYSSSTPRN